MSTSTIELDLLARFVPMSSLEAHYLRELCSHASVIELAADARIDEELRMVEAIYYLLDGELCMTGGGVPDVTIRSTDASARFALAGTESIGRHARAQTPVKLLRVERAKISTLMIWAQASGQSSPDREAQALRDDITALLMHSRLFARIPPSNIERVGQLIEPVKVTAGDTIVRQGEDGEYYFVIEAGRCEVLREADDGSAPMRLAQLGVGESFGEEALLTNSKRNATVRMLSDGVLLKLTRNYFVELISAPLLHEVTHERAEDLIATGARWIDVRLPEEFGRDGLDDAVNIPLGQIRARLAEFPRDGSYITMCNGGRRAQAAAFLLSQHGLHSCSLRDGIARRRPTKRGVSAIEESLPELQSELLRANAALEEALSAKAHADAVQQVEVDALRDTPVADDLDIRLRSLEEQTVTAGESLRIAVQRKQELETAVRDLQARETSSHRSAELEVERVRTQAKDSLDKERKRLSDHYQVASQQLEEVERTRREAEQRFENERLRIENELEQARIKMDAEAKRIRDAMEQAQRDAEVQAERIRSEHQSLEQDLRQRTEDSLRKEREHLEEEFSRSIAAQEKARQTMELAQAEKAEAEIETERLREQTQAEIQRRHDAELQAREARVQELRTSSESARQHLEQAQRAKDEAKARHQTFSATLTSARSSKDPVQEKTLRDELERASRSLQSADKALDAAQADHSHAQQAEQVAVQTEAIASNRVDELRLQIYEEMEEWIEGEQSRSSDELERAAQYARELERIQAVKEQKRRVELEADKSMFADIEDMLSGKAEDDPFNIAMRTHTIAEEKARLLQGAKLKAREDAERARAALAGDTKKG